MPEEYDNNFHERVFFDYLSDAYTQFFAGRDDFSESERQLEQQFDNRNAERLADIERLQEENDQLVKELTQLNIDAVIPPLPISIPRLICVLASPRSSRTRKEHPPKRQGEIRPVHLSPRKQIQKTQRIKLPNPRRTH